MKTFTALRHIDAKEQDLGRLQARLSYYGYAPRPCYPRKGERYLHFYAQFKDLSEIEGWVELRAWAGVALPSLEDIDWLSVGEELLTPLFDDYPFDLALDSQHTPFLTISLLRLVDDLDHTSEKIGLSSAKGMVMIDKWVPRLPYRVESERVCQSIMVPLTYIIGHTKCPIDALLTLAVGDVLLIEHKRSVISSHGTYLFTFELTNEGMMIAEPQDNEQDPVEEFTSDLGETLHLDTLPIELTMVLLEKKVPLSELKMMAPGEVMPLPVEAVTQVDIRANGQRFAAGELVQLADGRLGVEVRTLFTKG